MTGNTVIDAMQHTVIADYHHPELDWVGDSRMIFITAHRRENLGQPMHNMFRAIRRVLNEHPDVKAILPIHMNPIVRKAPMKSWEIVNKSISLIPSRYSIVIILKLDAFCALQILVESKRNALPTENRFLL